MRLRSIACCINLSVQRVVLIPVIVRSICHDQERFASSQAEGNHITMLSRIFGSCKAQKIAEHLDLFSTCSIHVLENEAVWYSLCIIPSTACQTTLRCDLYAVGSASDTVRNMNVSDGMKGSIQASLARFEAEFKAQKAGTRYEKPAT